MQKYYVWTLTVVFVFVLSCSYAAEKKVYYATEKEIKVDGNTEDWEGIKAETVDSREHLWLNKIMTFDKWENKEDFSFQWRAAWKGNKLFFLFEVTDDQVVEPAHKQSYHCDCVEIFLDHQNRGGKRLEKKRLNGYEIHFLKIKDPDVYITDYILSKPETAVFKKKWSGDTAGKKTANGYLMEIAFSVPDIQLKKGTEMGLETVVCDDDGKSRESQLTWTGTKGKFWLNMDLWGKFILK